MTAGVPLRATAGVAAVVAAAALAVLTLWLYRAVLVRRIAKRPETALARPRGAVEWGIGVGGGAAFVIAAFLIVVALAGCRVELRPTPGFGLATVPGILTMLILASVIEEVLFRGVLFEAVRQWLGRWAGLGISSVAFGVMHPFHAGATAWSAITITLEAGLMLGVVYLLTGSLWATIGIHAGWNAVEALVDIPVSEIPPEGLLTVRDTGSVWLNGGAFGLEGSAVPVVIGSLAAAVCLVLVVRRGSSAHV